MTDELQTVTKTVQESEEGMQSATIGCVLKNCVSSSFL